MTVEFTRDPLLIDERVSFYLIDSETKRPVAASETAGDGLATNSVDLVVVINPGSPRTTDGYPGTADRVLARYPDIHRHRCANGRSLGVRNEFARTEVAHLFEHIAIEELALRGTPRACLRGETSWDFRSDGPGVYRVTVHGVGRTQETRDALLAAAHSTVELMCG